MSKPGFGPVLLSPVVPPLSLHGLKEKHWSWLMKYFRLKMGPDQLPAEKHISVCASGMAKYHHSLEIWRHESQVWFWIFLQDTTIFFFFFTTLHFQLWFQILQQVTPVVEKFRIGLAIMSVHAKCKGCFLNSCWDFGCKPITNNNTNNPRTWT